MTKAIVHQARSERGVSLIDTMVTLAVLGIVASMATMQVTTVRRGLVGDGAMRLVMAQLTTAREMAITQRRNMEVQFVGNNWVQIIRNDLPSGTTVVGNVAMEGNVRYSLVPSVPDTPDLFGNSTAIAFGNATKIMFAPSGALVDNNGAPVNGTVFLSFAGMTESYRAVTVMGSIGRVRGWRWNGRTWIRV
jgi:Tfp pilus assembly protein FimT